MSAPTTFGKTWVHVAQGLNHPPKPQIPTPPPKPTNLQNKKSKYSCSSPPTTFGKTWVHVALGLNHPPKPQIPTQMPTPSPKPTNLQNNKAKDSPPPKRSAPQNKEATFPQFSKLPGEIQNQIWENAVPKPRVLKMTLEIVRQQPEEWRWKIDEIEPFNKPIYGLKYACRDSNYAVRRYKLYSGQFCGTIPYCGTKPFYGNHDPRTKKDLWLDLKVDTVFLDDRRLYHDKRCTAAAFQSLKDVGMMEAIINLAISKELWSRWTEYEQFRYDFAELYRDWGLGGYQLKDFKAMKQSGIVLGEEEIKTRELTVELMPKESGWAPYFPIATHLCKLPGGGLGKVGSQWPSDVIAWP